MRGFKGLAAVAGATLLIGLASPAYASPTTQSRPELDWTVTNSPDMDANYGFNSVQALAADDVWAVGSTVDQAWNGTVAAHWNGKAWKTTPTPEGLTLQGVSGVSGSDVWAVGLTENESLTAHWNGTKWSAVPSPQPEAPAGQLPQLYGVHAAPSGSEVWAVGCTANSDHTSTTAFAQRWNGKAWKLTDVPMPDGATDTCLKSVYYRSASEVWAVGRSAGADSGAPFTVRWDGTKWHTVPPPDIPQPDAELTGVISPAVGKLAGGVYAAGFAKAGFNNPVDATPLLLEWTGKKWISIETPDITSWTYGLGVDPAGGLLLTGYTSGAPALLLRWDGQTVTREPAPVSGVSAVMGVSTPPGGAAWIVGSKGASDDRMAGLAAHTPLNGATGSSPDRTTAPR